ASVDPRSSVSRDAEWMLSPTSRITNLPSTGPLHPLFCSWEIRSRSPRFLEPQPRRTEPTAAPDLATVVGPVGYARRMATTSGREGEHPDGVATGRGNPYDLAGSLSLPGTLRQNPPACQRGTPGAAASAPRR